MACTHSLTSSGQGGIWQSGIASRICRSATWSQLPGCAVQYGFQKKSSSSNMACGAARCWSWVISTTSGNSWCVSGCTVREKSLFRRFTFEPFWKPSVTPISYHFGYAKAYATLTRVEFFLTRSKLRKPLREVLTRPYASEGFAYAKLVITRPLLKMYRKKIRAAHLTLSTSKWSDMSECLLWHLAFAAMLVCAIFCI